MKTEYFVEKLLIEDNSRIRVVLEDKHQRQVKLVIFTTEDNYYLYEYAVDIDDVELHRDSWHDISKSELLNQFYKELALIVLDGYSISRIDLLKKVTFKDLITPSFGDR